MNGYQFKNWKRNVAFLMLLIVVLGGLMACLLPQENVPAPASIVVNPTQNPAAPADLVMRYTNDLDVDPDPNINTPGSLIRISNRTGVEFARGDLMYYQGGVLKEFTPTQMEFVLENKFLDDVNVKDLFIRLANSDGLTSTCVIHQASNNEAHLSCTGFLAPAPTTNP